MTLQKFRTTTLDWHDINVGDEVTPLEIPVTATVIVAGAIASRDFMPVHHDPEFAKKQGSPNMFMNILTTNGLCVRFLTDWAGPEAMVTELAIRLGVPAFPDDPLKFTGTVTGKSEGRDGEGFVEVAFKGSNSLGDHVSGTATLSNATVSVNYLSTTLQKQYTILNANALLGTFNPAVVSNNSNITSTLSYDANNVFLIGIISVIRRAATALLQIAFEILSI